MRRDILSIAGLLDGLYRDGYLKSVPAEKLDQLFMLVQNLLAQIIAPEEIPEADDSCRPPLKVHNP